MSNLIFPHFRGEGWNTERSVVHSTTIQESLTGMETRTKKQAYPRYRFLIKYNFLEQNALGTSEYDKLKNFFEQVEGRFDTFLYQDYNHYQVFTGYIAYGDGETSDYQLGVYNSSRVIPVSYIDKTTVTVYADGTPVDEDYYSVSRAGLVHFYDSFIPDSGVKITADFEYYYRVRFDNDDELTFTEFLYKLHSGSLKFITVLGETE